MPTALSLSGFMNSGQNAHALVQKVELIAELTLNKAWIAYVFNLP